VARFFDGARTLGEVIEESPFRVFDTLRVVKRLIDSGVLMPRTATAPSTGSHPAVPVNSNPSAVPRARTRSGAQIPVARTTQPRGMETLTAERRGVHADRRKSARRTPVPFEKPAAKPAPAPIPLVTKKSPSGAFAAGEIRAATKPRLTPQKPVAAVKREPSVEVRLDAVPLSLDAALPASVPNAAPAAAPAVAPEASPASAVTSLGHAKVAAAAPESAAPVAAAPVAAAPVAAVPAAHAPMSARQSSSAVKPHSKKAARVKTPVPHAPAFSDLEADFFAREADLYKSDSGDNFEDLEGSGKPRPVRGEGSRGVRSRKK